MKKQRWKVLKKYYYDIILNDEKCEIIVNHKTLILPVVFVQK